MRAGERLAALTVLGGSTINDSVWQQDDDPVLTWTDNSVNAPATDFSVAFDGVPDCTSETTTAQFSAGADSISNGEHTFQVRAIDAAGNCSSESEAFKQTATTETKKI